MKRSILIPCLMTLALGACGSPSDDKKGNSTVTTTEFQMGDSTNTAICDDPSKNFNPTGTFESISISPDGSLGLTTRLRFQEGNNGQGLLHIEISCQSGSASGSSIGQVRFQRQDNLVETLDEISIQAKSTNSATHSCSADMKISKTSFIISRKNSCLVMTMGGESRTFIPSTKGI